MTDDYGCRWCGLPADGHGTRYHHRAGLHTWQMTRPDAMPLLVVNPFRSLAAGPDGNLPFAPRPNRAARRAAARAARKDQR